MGPVRYRISIKLSDMKSGKMSDPTSCPISLAVGRKFGLDWESVVVGHQYVSIRRDERWVIFDLPRRALEWIRAFDAGDTASKMTFFIKERACEPAMCP